MFKITIKQTGSQKQIQHAAGSNARILAAFAHGLANALQLVIGKAGNTFMNGPTPTMLGVRTGRLRSALSAEVVTTESGVTGRVGDNVSYAAKWEFGFHGVETVRAHTRVIGWTGKGGRSFKTLKDVRDRYGNLRFREDIRPAHVRAGLSNFKSLQQVREYKRRVDLNPRPYLLPALEATDIGGEISKAIKDSTNG